MKHIKIRKGTWETNSSSTHALVIRMEMPKELPYDDVYFDLGEFGWEQREYYDIDSRCCYLHTALFQRFVSYKNDKEKYYEYRNKITSILKEYGVVAKWKNIETITQDNFYNYYIDHADELDDFIELVINNRELLIEWLFNNESLLVTDNDNNDMEYYNEAYEHFGNKEGYVFYGKGN